MENRAKLKAVQKMQDYIESHINEKITLTDLARAGGYSPWHSARIFKEITGKAPFDYIRLRRLSCAALKISSEKIKIIDVAFDFVFGSHEGFTRAFSRQFGLPPYSYSKNKKCPARLFLPEGVQDSYYRKLQKGEESFREKNEDMCKYKPDTKSKNTNELNERKDKMANKTKTNTVFVQVIDRPQRKLILKRGIKATHYYEYCEEVGAGVWDILTGIKEALFEPIGMWLPDNLVKEGTSLYAQGVEVPYDYNGQVPQGFDIVDLKPCKMMVFQGQPYDDEKFEEAISDLWDVIKEYDPSLYGFEWADENGPRFQLEPLGYRGYIEARPVRLLP